MEALLILAGLSIPIAWSAAFFMALGARKRLLALETRFVALEQRSFAAPAAQPAAQPAGARPETTPAPATPPAEKPAPTEPAPAEPAAETPEAASATPDDAVKPADTGTAATRPADAAHAAPANSPAAASPAGPPAGPGFEERLGTRWVVWVGGLALALGAIFLVRYSIEQGLIGPGLRIAFGALFAAALVAGGERARRKEALSGIAGLPQASIPAILTAAGTTAAYATVWAAHGLYGFVGPAFAFVLLGAVALATLGAALLHGPALAGLGLVGAYVTPMLVSSNESNFWALYLYLAVVTAAAYALARARLWRWLAITAVLFSAGWMLPGLIDVAFTPHHVAPHLAFAVAGFALAAALIVSGFLFGPQADGERLDPVSAGALVACLVATLLIVLASNHHGAALGVFGLLAAATVAIAWRAPSVGAAVPVAAVLVALVIAEWAVPYARETLVGPVTGLEGRAQAGSHMVFGAVFAVLFGAAGFRAQGRYARALPPILWSATAAAAPTLILVALYYRVADAERSIPFAALALLLAALYATATEILAKRERRPGLTSAEALFAVSAVASLALALTMALEKGWLTVALALMAPGIAMIAERRPLPMLRWLAAAVAVAVVGRVMWEPRIVGADIGTTPIFNWLLWGYGVPALCFWFTAARLRRRADDTPCRILDSAAILFTVLTLTLEIRHYVNGGDIYRAGPRLLEYGMQASALLAVAIGLERVRGRSGSIVHNIGAVVVAGLALCVIVFGLLVGENPLFTRVNVGGAVINLLLVAYGIPAVLAITLALVARETRPMRYRAVAAAASVVLTLTYLSLQVRRFFQGPVLHIDGLPGESGFTDAELWAYSAVWLAFGVVLLLVGIVLRSQPARLASAAVIFLTVLKVFLFDLAGVGGVWRSLSFIGLGLVLVGIGWLYQRLLFPPRPAQPAAQAAT